MSDWLQGDNAPGEDDAAPGEGGAPSGPNDPLNAPGFVQRAVSGIAQQFTTPGAAMQPNPYPAGSEEATWYDQNRQDTINNWAPGMALNTIGAGSAFAEPGALGAAGGKIKSLPGSNDLNMPRVPTADEMATHARVEQVPLSDVRAGNKLEWQRFNSGDHPPPLVEGYADKPVAVRKENGEYVVLDGNHRTALDMEAGATHKEMHVIDAKNYDPANAGRAPRAAKNQMSDDDLLKALGLDEPKKLSAAAVGAGTGAAFLQGSVKPADASTPNDARQQFHDLGATPGEMELFHIESGFRSGQVTGSNAGHAQFSPDLQKKYGITDPDNPEQVLHAVRAERADFEKATGRPLSDGEFYLMHQQGQAGGKALLNADPSASAWQTVRQFYGSDAVAKKAIWGNIPDSAKKQFGSVDNVSAGQFAQLWTSRFDGGQAPTQTASATPAAGAQEPAKPQTVGDRMKAWLRNQATPSNDQPQQQAPEKDDEPQQQAAIIPTPDPVSSVIRQGGKVYFRRYGRVYDDKGNAVG